MTALIRRNKKVVTYFSKLMVQNKQAEVLLSARKASTPRCVSARTPRALEDLGEVPWRASKYLPRPPGCGAANDMHPPPHTFLHRPPGGGAANTNPSDLTQTIDRYV